MKTRFTKTSRESGNVLLVGLGTATVIGTTLASYLLLVQNQSLNVARSQSWNHTMVVTEAGVEDGLQLINKHATTPNLAGWTNSVTEDGWAPISENVYSVRRYVGNSTKIYYQVYITNLPSGPTMCAVGYVPPPRIFSQAIPQSMFAQIGPPIDSGQTVTRKVVLRTRLDPLFNFALAAKDKIDLKGNNISTDSFDSSTTNYSEADGSYPSDPAKTKDNGDVVSDGTFTNTINVGNADIKGHVRTGPQGTVSIGPQGAVGSKAWVEGGNKGIQPSYASSDMNVQFPDVPSPASIYPNATWWNLPPPNKTLTVGTTTASFQDYSTSDYYKLPSIGGKIFIGTNCNVVIWVTGSSSFSGSDQIALAPGASLTLYTAGSFSMSGNATVNNLTKDASKFYLLGLPTCTSIDMKGNAAITGSLYAPSATLTLGGGGSSSYDYVGSAMAANITMNGHIKFHYDEALKSKAFGRGYIPFDWKETR